MPALLALIPTKDWIYCAIIVAGIVFGIHVHNKLLAEGVAEQQAADAKAAATLTAELKAKATMAEQAYDKEKLDNAAYRSANPVEPVRLCLSTSHAGSVPKAGQVPGTASPGAAGQPVQPVSSGDTSNGLGGAGPDISNLLDLLAGRADQVSAELREYQTRDQ
jgi:hypothetical protein